MNNRLRTIQSHCLDMDNSYCNQNMTYDPLQTMPLAMAYVPWQQWKNVYEGCKGLEHGTIFEELIFPFQFSSRMCRNSCMKQNHYADCNTNCNSRSDMCMTYNNMERNNCNNNCNNNYNYNRNNNSNNNYNANCNTKKTSNCERRCD